MRGFERRRDRGARPNTRRRAATLRGYEALEQRLVMNGDFFALANGSLTQDWSTAGLITANNDMSNVPSINAYWGRDLTTATGADPQTVTGAYTGVVEINANQSDTTISVGGVTEFDGIGNPVVAFQGSGTADAPYLSIYLNTTNTTGLHVHYDLVDIDADASNGSGSPLDGKAVQPVALQYRIGSTGSYTNVPAAFISNANGPGVGTTNTIDLTLPAALDNQAQVELRIITTNAVGSDAFIGVDNISVSATATSAGALQFDASSYTVNEGAGTATFTVNRVGGSAGAVSVNYATSNGTATAGSDYTASSGTLSFATGETSKTFTVPIIDDATVESTETFNLALSSPTGGASLGSPSSATVSITDNDSAGALQFDASSYTVNEAAGTATITVTRTGGSVGAVSINYATSNGTATAGSDYTATSGTLNFASGQSSASFTVPITNDSTHEPTETINLTLSSPAGGATLGSPSSAVLSIADNDAPTGVLLNEIDVNPPTGTDVPFEYIELRGTPGADLSGVYVVSVEGDLPTSPGGPGVADLVFDLSPYTFGSNGLLIIKSTTGGFTPAAGTTVVTSSFFDAATTQSLENDSNSFLVVYSPTALVRTTDYDTNNDGTLELPSGASLLDGIGWLDSDAGDIVYGTNLVPTPGTVPDAASRASNNTTPNSSSAWVFGDLIDTGDGAATVAYDPTKSNAPSGYALTPGAPNGAFSASGSFVFSTSNYTVDEGAGTVTVTVNLSGGDSRDFVVTVDYATSNGTATAGSDYTASSGTLGFAIGETTKTFTVPIINDSTTEPTETFNLTLSNPTNGAVVGSQGTATVSITDNDSPGVIQFGSPTYTVDEAAGTATITVTRTTGTVGAVSVNYATSNGTATAGSDYTAATGTLNFAAGQSSASFTVPITNDSIAEANETINLTLSSPAGGATLGSQSTAVLTILDNDSPANILLNEIDVNPPATDQPFEYVELSGPAGTTLHNVYFVSVEGDPNTGNSTPGTADIVISLDGVTFGSNGLIIIKATTGGFTPAAGTTVVTTPVFNTGTSTTLENGSNSFLLIFSPTPIVQTTDYDPTDSGTLSLPSGASILDGIGWQDPTTPGGIVYGGVTLTQSSGTPDAATRFPSNTTPLTAAAWYNADLLDGGAGNASTTYDATKASANFPAGGALTPGDLNVPAPAATIAFGQATYTVAENGGSATITVTRTGNTASAVSVNYATSNGTATAGSDYTAATGTLNFAAGQSSASFTVPITNDSVDEADETVNLTLSSPTGASLGSPSTAVLTITDDDTSGIAITDVSTAEGNSGTTAFTFTVSLSAANSRTVTVDYATANGTATAGSDYTAGSGTLTFAPGETSKTITVSVNGDTTPESDETFFVNLTNAANASITDSQGVGTIVNDDSAASFTINDVSIVEGKSGTTNAVFSVTLSQALAQTATVSYATANGTATAGSDYTAGSGTLTFAPGVTTQTISVPVTGDITKEPSETFFVNLSNPTGGASIADAQGIGTIVNDDTTVAIDATATATEGNSGTSTVNVKVSLNAAVPFPVTVNYATADGTATAGSDYVAASGTVTIPANTAFVNLPIQIIGDTLDEANETFTIQLSSPTNAILKGTGKSTVTITDDDAGPTVSINDVSMAEGNSGTKMFSFTVSLSAASGQSISIPYSTADGTATTAGADYTAKSATLIIPAGATSGTITIVAKGDIIQEADETFFVNLGTPTNATIADGQGVGTIVNDDFPTPSITISDVSLTEGNSGNKVFTFTVSLSNAYGAAVKVNYATAPGTATATTDYTSKSATLTIAAGATSATISINVKGDTVVEPNETFFVNLSNPVNATIADAQGIGTILNDDGALLLAAGTARPSAPAPAITVAGLKPIVNAAIGRWRKAGLGAAGLAALKHVSFQVADLAGDQLGQTSADGTTVTIDRDAAGVGWYVDRTPGNDSEFSGGLARGAASGRVDLLTVVEHELGHVLGLEHSALAGDVMDDTLGAGVRHAVQSADVAIAPVAAHDAAIDLLSMSPAARRFARRHHA